MATLSIRALPDDIYKILKERADKDNRSINQEAIWLLKEGLAGSSGGDAALWERIGKRRQGLADRGKRFSDSTRIVRKDRER